MKIMTIGIYKLNFNSTDGVYIGQSINIEKRFIQHKTDMRNSRSSPKLQKAYLDHGLPNLEILCECSIQELDSLEEEAIQIFDCVENGFNTYTSSIDAPVLKGSQHGNAKFSKEQILYVAELLTDPTNSFAEISRITKVTVATIAAISSLSVHLWILEERPDLYEKIKELKNTRIALNSIKRGDSISAKNQGISYPPIKDPQGVVYKIDNAYAFAREHGLRGNHLTEVLNGHRKSHMGWKVCPEEQV